MENEALVSYARTLVRQMNASAHEYLNDWRWMVAERDTDTATYIRHNKKMMEQKMRLNDIEKKLNMILEKLQAQYKQNKPKVS